MIYLIVLTIISFMLDGILSNYINYDTVYLFKPFFSLVSLVLIYPYLNYNKREYFIIALILGLTYDILYTNTFLLNGIIFVFIAYLILNLFNILKNNIINSIVINLLIIFMYNSLIYFIHLIFKTNTIPITLFLSQVLFIFIVNSIYLSILYFLIKRLKKKLKLKSML